MSLAVLTTTIVKHHRKLVTALIDGTEGYGYQSILYKRPELLTTLQNDIL